MHLLKVLSLISCMAIGISAFGQDILTSTMVKTLDGQEVDLLDYINNKEFTLISTWASWYAPSKKKLDAIANRYPEWQKNNKLAFIAISIDSQRQLAKVKPMVESKGWSFTVLPDADNQLRKNMGIVDVPHTFLVNNRGEIVYSHTGFSAGDVKVIEEKILPILEQ